ncbi:MAG TPA: GTPase domain-containing protein [Methylomirabilota bacterium]|nr:GTPase domain-containing protein [Methylomirabilota bacterium]
MVFFNWATMQMAAKIVYYGPGLCGKTSNLSYIYAKTTPTSRGEMVSLETESDRTLFFDLLPIEVGTIGGFKTRLQLYTVPGQVFYNTTRKLVLKGVDGLVFVADSQRPMREANIESFASLVDNLEDLGLEMVDLPLVLQYNKRDLKNILTIDELNHDLNEHGSYPTFEASAINGTGVFETLKEITKLTLKKLRRRMASSQPGAALPASSPVRPVMPPQRRESISAAALARAAEEGVVSSNDPPPAAAGAPEAAVPQPETPPSADRAPGTAGAIGFGDEAPAPPEPGPGTAWASGTVFDSRIDDETAAEPEAAAAPRSDAEGGPTFEPAAATDPWREEDAADEEQAAPEPGPSFSTETDPGLQVEFDRRESDEVLDEPPPVKRVHVSNQLDILAELEGLRSGVTAEPAGGRRTGAIADIDIDSLISGAVPSSKEIRRKIRHELNSDVFDRMGAVEVTINVRDTQGTTIHTLEPVSMTVDDAGRLSKLSLRFLVDLDHLQ